MPGKNYFDTLSRVTSTGSLGRGAPVSAPGRAARREPPGRAWTPWSPAACTVSLSSVALRSWPRGQSGAVQGQAAGQGGAQGVGPPPLCIGRHLRRGLPCAHRCQCLLFFLLLVACLTPSDQALESTEWDQQQVSSKKYHLWHLPAPHNLCLH